MKKFWALLFFTSSFFPASTYAQENNKWEFDYPEMNDKEITCLGTTFDEFDNDPIIDGSRLRKLLPTRRPASRPARFISDNNKQYFEKLKVYNINMGATYDEVNDIWMYNEVTYDMGSKLDKATEVANAIEEYEFSGFYKSDGHAVVYDTNDKRWKYANVVIYNDSDNTWVYDGKTYTSVIALDRDVFKHYENASEYSIHKIYNNKWSGIYCRQKAALREFYLNLKSRGGNNIWQPNSLVWPIDSPNNGIFDYEGIDGIKGSSGSLYVRTINLSDYRLEGGIPESMFLPGIFYGTSEYPVIHNTSSFIIENNPGLCIDSSIRQIFDDFRQVVTVLFSTSYQGDVTDVIPDCSIVTNTESEELPDEITLAGNYPNPFNPTTLITYRLTKPVHVYLAVHDITGRKITVLADGIRPAGEHRVTFDAKDLSTGHYIYTLHADGYAKARTMIFVK